MSQNFASDLFAMTNDSEQDMLNIENALFTLKSSFSGSSAPSAEQGQLWYDTTRNLLRHRGAASNWRGVVAFKSDATYSTRTKMWVYAYAVEEGFTEDTNVADCLISVRGGSNAYSVGAAAGDGTERGSWTISGLTINNEGSHTHGMNDHTHSVSSDTSYDAGAAITVGKEGATSSPSPTDTESGEPHTHTSSFGNSWRPYAAVGIMIYPSTV